VASSTPTSAAQAYEQAIVLKDGGRLCATFAPKLREVLAEQFTDEQSAAVGPGGLASTAVRSTM
jgi:ubiquinone biosynthesis protein UbiJ